MHSFLRQKDGRVRTDGAWRRGVEVAVLLAVAQKKREGWKWGRGESGTAGVKKSRSEKERETEEGCYGNRNMAALQKP